MGVKRGSLVCAAAGEQLFCIGGWDAADYLDMVCCLFGNPPSVTVLMPVWAARAC